MVQASRDLARRPVDGWLDGKQEVKGGEGGRKTRAKKARPSPGRTSQTTEKLNGPVWHLQVSNVSLSCPNPPPLLKKDEIQ